MGLAFWGHYGIEADPPKYTQKYTTRQSGEYRDAKEQQVATLLPPTYHDEDACHWPSCKSPTFTHGVSYVCCETCPNAAHKRQ